MKVFFFRAGYLGEELSSRARRGAHYKPVVLGVWKGTLGQSDTGRCPLGVKPWRATGDPQNLQQSMITLRCSRLASPMPLEPQGPQAQHRLPTGLWK